MSRRRPEILICGCLWATVALLSCQGRSIDLERLLELHTEARGGREALESVTSLRVELHLVEPEFEADLVYQAMRPHMARVDVTIGGRLVFTEAINDSGAWQQAGGDQAPSPSSPEGTAALRRGAIGNLYGMHELQGLGYRLGLLELTDIEGTLYLPVEVTSPDGHKEVHYIDPVSYLVTRQRDVHAIHPDLDPTERWIESRSSDFRTIDGIVRSFQSADWDLNTGERVQVIELMRVEVNPSLDVSIFSMPEASGE
jgi:hypothetical protein